MPDWGEILNELNSFRPPQHPVDVIRRKYLNLLYKKTSRNIIAYYSAWLQKGSMQERTAIADEDKNAFMTAVHNLDPSQGLDLILHTPGGDTAATESLVKYIKSIFGNNFRVIVPQLAMSAGTMIACASSEIIMGKQSSLGPIDPHYGVVPCQAVVQEFKDAIAAIKSDPASLPIWKTMVEKYPPAFVQQCLNAISFSENMVKGWLKEGMFAGEYDSDIIVEKIVQNLMSFEENKVHARHLHYDDCRSMGLKILSMEDDNELQDLILSVHHSFIHTFGFNPLTQKIVENHKGQAMFLNSDIPRT